jgi:hypothetical protein
MALGNELTAYNGNGRKRRLVKMETLCGFILSQKVGTSVI